MAMRDVIEIDEQLCDGCGQCVTACAEGAIAVIDGKARLVSDVYCDGLGACLGECPQGAIRIVRRDAQDFDEQAVERHLAAQRPRSAHGVGGTLPIAGAAAAASSCPGAQARSWPSHGEATESEPGVATRLRQWPIQLHLVPPTAPFFRDADVLLAADCVAFAVGGFHGRFLNGHALAIACPKLDSHQEIYLNKLVSMIDEGAIRSLEVMVMEVPCCGGLLRLAEQARTLAQRRLPLRYRVVGVQGEIIAQADL